MSQTLPFQTIEEALNVVKPNDIINILQSTYPISQHFNLNSPVLILKEEQKQTL